MLGTFELDVDAKHLLEIVRVIKKPRSEVSRFVRPDISRIYELQTPETSLTDVLTKNARVLEDPRRDKTYPRVVILNGQVQLRGDSRNGSVTR